MLRFDKPRLVAGALVESLLQVPAVSIEILTDLNKFISENVTVLRSLELPDLGDLILFSLASRCVVPYIIRVITHGWYPTVTDLFTFLKSRIAVLECVQGVSIIKPVFSSRPKYQASTAPKLPRRSSNIASS